jgi:hypothetical protein
LSPGVGGSSFPTTPITVGISSGQRGLTICVIDVIELQTPSTSKAFNVASEKREKKPLLGRILEGNR